MNPENKRDQGGARLRKEAQRQRPPQRQQPVAPKRQNAKPAKPKRSRAQVIRHRILIIATVISALIVVGFAVWNLTFVKPPSIVDNDVPQIPLSSDSGGDEFGGIQPKTSGDRKEDFYTFLVIGRDTGGGGNTDTILLAAYDVKNQKLNVMSIPRDTMVNIPYDIKRINAVYNYAGGGDDGIKALNKEVSQLVGFIPNYQVIVEWDAVGELVNAIGGVTFDVPRNMNYEDPTQDLYIHLSKGVQKLNGDQAMQVIRYRHDNDMRYGYPDGDLGRIKTQQAFLKAVIEQCLQFKNVTKIGELAEVFNQNVTTNLTVNNLLWFGKEAIMGGLTMDNVNFVTMPNTGANVWSRSYSSYQSYVTPNADELVELVNEYFNPFQDPLQKNELDIMYVSKDGTVGSTTGVLEDRKANNSHSSSSSGSGSSNKKPVNPVESDEPVEPSETPVTEGPDASVSPDPSRDPAQAQDPNQSPPPSGDPAQSPAPSQAPEVSVAPTVAPVQSDQPVISAAPMPTVVPTPPPAVPTSDSNVAVPPPEQEDAA